MSAVLPRRHREYCLEIWKRKTQLLWNLAVPFLYWHWCEIVHIIPYSQHVIWCKSNSHVRRNFW